MPTVRPFPATDVWPRFLCGVILASLALFVLPVVARAQAPANDLCESAVDLNAVAKPYSSGPIGVLNATNDPNANPACDSVNSGAGANRGIWWKYTTGTTSERITFQLPQGVGTDQVLSLWTGPDCASLTPYICTDGDQAQQGLTIVLPKNSTYYILSSLWSANTPTQAVNLGLFMTAPLPVADQPPGGVCEGATIIPSFPFTGASIDYSTSLGTPETPSCALPTFFTNRTAGGIWYAFTPTAPTVITCREPGPEDVTFSLWSGACGSLTQVACADGGTGAGETAVFGPLDAGVPYRILLSRGGTSTGSRSWPLAGATISLSVTAVFAPPAAPNDMCVNATAIAALPFDSGNVIAFSNSNDDNANPSCDASTLPEAAVRGVWFTLETGPTGGTYILRELNSLDVVASIWTGAECSTLTQLACDDSAVDSSGGWAVELPAMTACRVLVSMAGATSPGLADTYRLTVSRIAPPVNDTCETAITVNFPAAAYTQTNVDIRGAQPDRTISCLTPAGSTTRRGIWHRVVPAAGDVYTLTVGETGSEDTIRAVFVGGCDSLVEVACADAETGVQAAMTGGSIYHVLTAQAGTSTGVPASNLTVTLAASASTSACCTATTCTVISQSACRALNGVWRGPASVTCSVATNLANACRPAPSNDSCETAAVVAGPFPVSFSTAFPAAASDDQAVSCTTGTSGGVPAVRFGVWYVYDSGADAGTLRFSQTGGPDTIRAVFTGTCGSLVEVSCLDPEVNQTISVAPFTRYFVLLGTPGGAGTPTASYQLTFNEFTPVLGACCNATACSVVARSACPGFWRGQGTTCGVQPTYVADLAAPVPIPDASLAGVALPLTVPDTAGVVTDLDVQLTLTTHTYAGDLIVRLVGPGGATVDLLARPGGGVSGGCTPPAIVLAGSSNDLGAGVYTFDDQAPTTLFSSVLAGSLSGGSFRPSSCAGEARSLNAVFAGQPGAGTWTIQAFDLSPGDQGSIQGFGLIVNGVVFGPCDSAGSCCSGYACSVTFDAQSCAGTFTMGQTCAPNPCLPPTVLCCRGTTCAIIPPAQCTVPAGVGVRVLFDLPCNVSGAAAAPCCYADFNHDDLVNLDDLFQYLAAWFGGDVAVYTKIGGDGAALPNFEDLLIYINLWFAGC